MHAESEAPTDTALLTVLRQFDSEGFAGQFQAVEGPALLCLTCHRTSPLSSVDANRIVRLEGASDPSDMLVVIPVACPECSTRGTLVSNFGPEATLEEADLLVALDRTPVAPETDHPHPPA
jgi:hypothetical protein